MFRVGASSCGRLLTRETFEAYQRAGVGLMEVSAAAPYIEEVDAAEVAAYAKEYGVELWSFHLPFSKPYIISHTEWDIPGAIERNSELIKRWSAVGVDKFIIHPSPDNHGGTHDSRMEPAKESLAMLAEIAHREGAVMCVEDLPRTCLGRCSDDMLELLSVDDRLRVCFDTNHLLIEDNLTFIRRLGDKIVTTHVSDYDFVNERHWIPGEGKVDWQALIAALKEVGYNGVWMYEVGPQCPEHIIRDRDVTIADLALNAKELFAGQMPTRFSTPHPNP
ncbi:MAG: sugar phosphate isomerase/epimerase, partial [Clostridia bacterium]|nr:sugar phosphate isomerase/epimerase [Clostridia bacterium]